MLREKSKHQDSVFAGITPFFNERELSYLLYANTTFAFSSILGANLINDAIYKYFKNVNQDKKVISASIAPLPFTKYQQEVIGKQGYLGTPIIIVIGMAFVPAYYAGYLVKEKEVKHIIKAEFCKASTINKWSFTNSILVKYIFVGLHYIHYTVR